MTIVLASHWKLHYHYVSFIGLCKGLAYRLINWIPLFRLFSLCLISRKALSVNNINGSALWKAYNNISSFSSIILAIVFWSQFTFDQKDANFLSFIKNILTFFISSSSLCMCKRFRLKLVENGKIFEVIFWLLF